MTETSGASRTLSCFLDGRPRRRELGMGAPLTPSTALSALNARSASVGQMQTGSPFKTTKLAPRFLDRPRSPPRTAHSLAPGHRSLCYRSPGTHFPALCASALRPGGRSRWRPPPRRREALQRRAPRRAARQRLAQLVEMLAHLLSSPLDSGCPGRASPSECSELACQISTPPVEAGSRCVTPPDLASARTVGLAAKREMASAPGHVRHDHTRSSIR